MRVAILLLNSGRGSGEVARQQARYLASNGCRVFFMHPGIKDGVAGAVNTDIELHCSITPVHEYLPSAGRSQEQVARMPYERVLAYLQDYERALVSIIDDVDIVVGHHASISAIATANTARHAGKPYVLFLHGTGIEPRHEGMKEHFGIIYAEALAAGTPPVAYEGGGVSSIITDATGILTQRDPKSLGCAIRELLANPERLAMMARAGRGRAQEKFS